MSEPQQPEIARARRGAVSEAAAKTKATRVSVAAAASKPAPAPVPEENLPGHHPEVDQDKPVGPPSRVGTRAEASAAAKPKLRKHRSAFLRDEPFATASRVFGVTSENSYVDINDGKLEIRFGPWRLTTPISNVAGAQVTGPYAAWKVLGPAHLSLRDRGITFATSNRRGVCIQFNEPVPALEPRGLIRHPAATVTVEDADELVRFIAQATEVSD
jgi:hypothetical protein